MKGLIKGPSRNQPGLLFKTQFAVDMFNVPRTLEDLGFTLNRAHRKENDGLGATVQLMLVYERGTETITRTKRWEAEHAFFGNTGKREGYLWQVQAFKNPSAGRVPPHIYLHTGNPKEVVVGAPELDLNVTGAFEINGETASADKILGDLTMVRISVNLYPHMKHLIPSWVEVRKRHNERLADQIGEVFQS